LNGRAKKKGGGQDRTFWAIFGEGGAPGVGRAKTGDTVHKEESDVDIALGRAAGKEGKEYES